MWSVVALADKPGADKPVSEQAKLYFGNGVELMQSSPPNYQDAYYQFKLAYQESESWKVLGNLGLCALKLERDGEAFQYYTEYLQQGGNEIDPGERAALEREMLLITGNSATVTLTASAEGAELVVSRGGSSAPPQAYKFENSELGLRLRVGTHTLTATAPDGRRRAWEVSISPGQEASHHFNFDSKEEPAGGTRGGGNGESSRTRESGGALRTVGFVVTGVGAAALMGGAITGILAKNKESEATDGCYADVGCQQSADPALPGGWRSGARIRRQPGANHQLPVDRRWRAGCGRDHHDHLRRPGGNHERA